MKNYQSKDVLPFIYGFVIALSSAANGSQNLTLEASSWFELHYMMASTDTDQIQSSTISAQYPNNFTCQITDQSSGRQMSSAKVPQRCMFGPANQFASRNIRPIVFAPNTVLQFDFLNLVAATNNVTISLIGYKVFNPAVV